MKMRLHVDESLRMKRMAALVDECDEVLDIGWAQTPNPYLTNKVVTGFDINSRNLPENYTSCVIGKAEDLSRAFAPKSFDAILAGEIIEHIETPYAFLRDCQNLLCPSGRLVLSTPNPNSPIERILTLTLNKSLFYTHEHVLIYPQRWLIRMLEASGFDNVKLYSGGFPAPFFGTIPFPRPWCHQTIAVAWKSQQA